MTSPNRSHSPLRLVTAPVPGADLAAAVDACLSQPDLAAGTRAKYRQTLTVVEGELGDARVTGAALAGVIATLASRVTGDLEPAVGDGALVRALLHAHPTPGQTTTHGSATAPCNCVRPCSVDCSGVRPRVRWAAR